MSGQGRNIFFLLKPEYMDQSGGRMHRNCDFSSNNNVWTKFYEFFQLAILNLVEFGWVIFIMTD